MLWICARGGGVFILPQPSRDIVGAVEEELAAGGERGREQTGSILRQTRCIGTMCLRDSQPASPEPRRRRRHGHFVTTKQMSDF